MRATMTAIVLTGLCATTLFSACKKSDYMTPDNSNNPQMQSMKADENSNVNLQFKSGSLYTTAFIVRQNQAALADLGGYRMWNLTSPVLEAGLPLKVGSYNNLTTTIQLMSHNGTPGMHLFGTVVTRVSDDELMARNVDFSINAPMMLEAKLGSLNVTASTTLMDLLNLHLDKLGAGISMDTWNKAMADNQYTIYVSEQNNSELFQAILKNLESMVGTPTSGGPLPWYVQAHAEAPSRNLAGEKVKGY